MIKTIPAEQIDKDFVEVRLPLEGNLVNVVRAFDAYDDSLSGTVLHFYVDKADASRVLEGTLDEVPAAYMQIQFDEDVLEDKKLKLVQKQTGLGAEILAEVTKRLVSDKSSPLFNYSELRTLQQERNTASRVDKALKSFIERRSGSDSVIPTNQDLLDFYHTLHKQGWSQLGEKPYRLIEHYLLERGFPIQKGDIDWSVLHGLERKQKSNGLVPKIRRAINHFASENSQGRDEPLTDRLLSDFYNSLLPYLRINPRGDEIEADPDHSIPFGTKSFRLLEAYLVKRKLLKNDERFKGRVKKEGDADWDFFYELQRKQKSNGVVPNIQKVANRFVSENSPEGNGPITDDLLSKLYTSLLPHIEIDSGIHTARVAYSYDVPFGIRSFQLLEKYLVARGLVKERKSIVRVKKEGEVDLDVLYRLERRQKSSGIVSKLQRAADQLASERSSEKNEPFTDSLLNDLYHSLLSHITINPKRGTIEADHNYSLPFGAKSFQLLETYLVARGLLKNDERFKGRVKKEGDADWDFFYELQRKQKSHGIVANIRKIANRFVSEKSPKREEPLTDRLLSDLYQSLLPHVTTDLSCQIRIDAYDGIPFGTRSFRLLETYLVKRKLLKKEDIYNVNEDKASKRETLESKSFLDTIQEEGIDLEDLKTVKSKKAKRIFRQQLGINVESPLAQEHLESLMPARDPNQEPQYRKIVTEWDESDSAYLSQIAQFNNSSESNILSHMASNREEIEERLGRTLFACQMKMVNMGLISPFIRYGPDNSRNPEIVYPFPRIHSEEEPQITNQFNNYRRLLEARLEPEVIPALAFESVATINGRPQFLHATIPVGFNGINLENYAPFEQQILTTLQHYLSDPSSFVSEGNFLRENIHNGEANILALQQRNGRRYAQVFLRTAFSIEPERVETNAIRLPNGSEIYLFKHDRANVTFESTRK